MPDPTLAETTPAPAREASPASGARAKIPMLGKYRIAARLGKGGMGIVYQAEDTLLQRLVAIKVLPRRLSGDPVALERFLFEARAAARLSHPNIVLVYEISEVQGGWFLVMELVSGGSAQAAVQKRGPLPWRDAVGVVADACRGLVAAHETGLIHRDIKPANVLLTPDGVGKLADFGLAKALDGETPGPTSPETVLGTPAYMSPEQCRALALDARSDLYSLGATLYTLLTGKPPFELTAPIEVLYAHCNAARPDPRRVRPDVPAALVTLLHAAMAINPADRFASAREMLQALERVVVRAESAAAIPVVVPEPAAPPPLPRQTLRQRAGDTVQVVVPADSTADVEPIIARKPTRPPDSPTRRWLLRGLATAAGLGALLWVAGSDKDDVPEAAPPAPGGTPESPFWRRVGPGGVGFPVGGAVSAVAVSPDLRWLAAASETAGISVWNLTTGLAVEGLQGIKPREQTRALAWMPDGRTLVAGLLGRLVAVTPATGQVVETRLPIPPANAVPCLAFAPNSDVLLFARQGLSVGEGLGSQLFLTRFPRLGKEGSTATHPVGAFLAAGFTPDGREVLTLGQDGTVRAFDVRILAPAKVGTKEKAEAGERGRAFALAVTPNLAPENRPIGPYFAVADERGLFFRRTTDWAVRIPCWPLEGVQPRSITYSATSRFWAAGVSDGRVLIRDNHAEKMYELVGHKDAVRAVAFAAQGALLATGSDDKTVRLTRLEVG